MNKSRLIGLAIDHGLSTRPIDIASHASLGVVAGTERKPVRIRRGRATVIGLF